MIVTTNRQDLEPLRRRKTEKKNYLRQSARAVRRRKAGMGYLPLRSGSGRSGGSSGEDSLAVLLVGRGYEVIFLTALMVFLLLLGTEIPYRQARPFLYAGLRNLQVPGPAALENVEVRALRAESRMVYPGLTAGERTILWEVPGISYTINPGDTISQISRHYGVSVGTIISINRVSNVRKLASGQVLRIPRTEGILYTWQKDDTLEGLTARFALNREELIRYNPYLVLAEGNLKAETGQELFLPGTAMEDRELRERMGELYIFPIQGVLLTSWGTVQDPVTRIDTFHNGIDLKGNVGDPVSASLNGTVIAAGFNSSYGNYIILDHRNGYRSLYAHLGEFQVSRNDKVLQGEVIGTVGMTGFTRTPHLHFSLFKGKKSIDPLDYLH